MPIRFGTYNIRNGRNGGLESAIRGVSKANMDLGIFQEIKCTDGIYTHESAGYSVVATDVPSQHCGRVAVFYRPSPHFAVEVVRQFGPNVVGFHLATGARRWYIIGCYLVPDNTSTIESVVVGRRTAGAGRSKHDADGAREQPEGNGHCGGADRSGTRGHGNALPPAPAQMGQGKEDVEHGQGGEVSPIPDGLHPRDRPSSLLERVCLGLTTQHRSLYGDGLPSQRPQEGTNKIPHGAQATSPPTTIRPHAGGWDICGPTEGRAKTTCKGEKE